MEDLQDIIKRIIKERQLDTKTTESHHINNNYYLIEGVNIETADEEKYLICDCHLKNNYFDFKDFNNLTTSNQLESDYIPVFIFKNWDHEMEQYYKNYDKLNGVNKNKLNEVFRNKLSIYTDLEKEIKLEVEKPENYNEYEVLSKDKTLEGYIYNISLFELKKLYNVTGTELFKKNVRKGLKKNSTIDEIKVSFRNYIYTHIYNQLNKMYPNLKENGLDAALRKNFNINEENIKFNRPEYFWFCHNGITIYSYNVKPLDRSGCYISLNPRYVSVINGAQTLTNFYLVLEETKREFVELLDEDFKIYVKNIEDILSSVHKDIYVKAIFISGDEKYVKTITYGLNKQVPILMEHILADSDNVRDINMILKKDGVEILKEGDTPFNKIGLDVIDFLKKHLIIIGLPGTSKNLSKNQLEEKLKEAFDYIKKDENNQPPYASKIKLLCHLDSWWRRTKKARDDKSQSANQLILNSYGKNYFGSYILDNLNNKLDLANDDDDSILIQYIEFIKEFSMNEKLSLKDFKTDDLYKKHKKIFLNKQHNISNDIDLNALKIHLNATPDSRYIMNYTIMNFLSDNNISLPYFRVITRINGNCKEYFPFSNSTFTELYIDENKDISQIDFKTSKFKNQIEDTFPVFIIDKGSNNDDKIISISYLPKFSFQEFENDAEYVFNQTKKAFIEGDSSLFTKVSDNKHFHIRPKAIDSNDTFEFTNGELITKRTFWANKNTLNEIINKLMPNVKN